MATVGETQTAARGSGNAQSSTEARPTELLSEADRYLAELIEEVGEPTPEEMAEAEAWYSRITGRFNNTADA